MRIAGKAVLVLVVLICVHCALMGQEDKYCINIQYNLGLETHAFHYALAAQLESALFKTEKYIHASHDMVPILKVEIGIKSLALISNDEKSEPEYSAISIAYVFFPKSINYYAYSNCYLA